MMVRGSGRKSVLETQEVLSPAEKIGLLEQKQELEDTLREVDSFGKGTSAEQLDKEAIKRQIRHIDTEIAQHSVEEPKGKNKDSLIREANELEVKLREGLPTSYEMAHPAKCPGAVRKHMGWLDRNKARINRWRYIQNVINPDAPKSIEELREPGKARY